MTTSTNYCAEGSSIIPKTDAIERAQAGNKSEAVLILARETLSVIECSASVEAMFGYKPGDTKGLNFDAWFEDGDELADFKRCVEALSADKGFGIIRYYYLKHKAGYRFQSRICISPAGLTTTREPVLACTVEKSAIPDDLLQRIRLYENCCRMIADVSSEYIYYMSPTENDDFKCEWFTDSLPKIIGFSHADIEAMGGWEMLIHPDDYQQATRGFESASNRYPSTTEYRIIDRNGCLKHVIDHRRPVWNADRSRVTGIVGFIKDITILRKLEQTIGEMDLSYQRELESLPMMLAKYNLVQGKFVYWNREKNLSGHSLDEWNNLTREEQLSVIHSEDRERIDSLHRQWRQKADNSPLNFECRVRRSDGIYRWMEFLSYKQRASDGSFINSIQMSWDIDEKRRAYEELKLSQEMTRLLAAHEIQGREIERRRIARELHDELAQVLTAFKFDISYLRKRIGKRNRPLLERTLKMEELVDSTIKTVKRLTTELHPFIIDLLGLSAAIEAYVEQFEERTGIKMDLQIDPREISLDAGKSIVIYRIVQEALSNIARHAKATEARLWLVQRGDFLNLRIQDNGVGFNTEKLRDPKSFGLLGMRERVELAAGELKITSSQGKGTIIEINISAERSEDLEDKGIYRG